MSNYKQFLRFLINFAFESKHKVITIAFYRHGYQDSRIRGILHKQARSSA